MAGVPGRGPKWEYYYSGRGGSDTTAVALAAALKAKNAKFILMSRGSYNRPKSS